MVKPSDPSESQPKPPAVPPDSPYHAPSTPLTPADRSLAARDHSISAEPWFNQLDFVAATHENSELVSPPQQVSLAELAEHSVWDESSTSPELSGIPAESSVTWFRFYLSQAAQTPGGLTWLTTLFIIVLAGPLAILGALFTGLGYNGFVMLVIMGPTIEEILKIALPLWVIEKRPWLFAHPLQIMLCAIGAGLIFAVIENVIYLNIYIPHPTERLVIWRWTACVLLHTGCSAIAAGGLIKIRYHSLARGQRPHLTDGSSWIAAAIVIHGLYNFAAILVNDWFQ